MLDLGLSFGLHKMLLQPLLLSGGACSSSIPGKVETQRATITTESVLNLQETARTNCLYDSHRKTNNHTQRKDRNAEREKIGSLHIEDDDIHETISKLKVFR